MKKFLSMFAFAAAIVWGAFALASCGDDDEFEPRHHFTLEFEVKSSNPEIANNPNFIEATKQFSETMHEQSKKYNFVGTDLEGGTAWMNVLNSKDFSDMKKMIDQIANILKDPTIKLYTRMLKDGEPYKEHTYMAFYTGL